MVLLGKKYKELTYDKLQFLDVLLLHYFSMQFIIVAVYELQCTAD